MLQIQLQLDNKTINLDPLDNVTVPSCLDLNDTLQHQESQVNVSIEYDSAIHKILVENNSIPVSVIEDGKKIFTGIIDSGLSWTDNGTPEPLNNIALVIFDNTYKLQNTAETPIAYINSSLTEIITKICKLCDLTYSDEGLLDAIQIPVFILNRDQEFYQAVNDLLFEYGFAFGFTGAGELKIINLKQSYDDQIIENLFTGVKFSRTKRKYTGIELNYGKITKKDNEQVYFEGGDLGEDNKIIPIIITPGSYYPFESDPRIESTEGQVYQEFSSGYAETQTLYNGEKRYTRSKDTQLLYTENHKLVEDYSDNLTVDRTEFAYTQASVRFVNNSNTDAELKQLAIRATAYYRSPVQLIRGDGKKFKYDSKYIYAKDSANALAALMQNYFLGGNFKITFKTTQKLIPGQKTKINTGLSGIIANVIILSATKDIYSEIYDITALTEQNITLDEKKWQIQKSMTASQVLERTEIDNITIQTITTEYYLSDSRTELIGGTWEKTPPTATADKYIWTKTIYIYTNGRTEESNPVSISGEPGPQGAQGATGPQGAQGPKGDTGATGAQGPKGDTGPQGAQGQRGGIWYQGTAITGVNQSGAIFSSSGITNSIIGDQYLNTETKDIYICVLGGNASAAKWAWISNLVKAEETNLLRFEEYSNQGSVSSGLYAVYEDGEGPFGVQKVLKCYRTPDNNVVWGAIYVDWSQTPVDANKKYRFSYFINQKVTSDYNETYLGVGVQTDYTYIQNLSGTAENNAYFSSSSKYGGVSDRWYMVVGHVHPNGYTDGVEDPDSGVYDVATGKKVATCTDYKWAENPPSVYWRQLICYNGTNIPTTGETWVCNPRIDICNGNQPSIESLLHGNTHVMQWYSGTGITGTSTTETAFPNSGISYAIIGDKYINTDTNNVYRCTYNGDASVAKWIYETNIQGEDSLGFAVKLNASDLSTTATGTIFVSGYENSVQANVNGYVRYLGNKITVTKTALKPSNQFIGWIAIPVTGGTPVLAYRTVAGQWKSISNGTSTDITGSNYVAIAEARFESSLKATASSVIEPIRLDVLGGNIRSIYWGKASSNPAFSAVLAIGHFYLNTSNGNIYSYNGITWELNNATDLEMQCMTDLLEIAQSSSSIGTPTFINKLVAYTAFINKLLSKEVTIDASTFGYIKSSNFATTNDDWIKSTTIPTAGFGIYAGENGISSIGTVVLRSQLNYFKNANIRQLYTQTLRCDDTMQVYGYIEVKNLKEEPKYGSLPSTYISSVNTESNHKPKSGSGITLGYMHLGDGMADNLHYINASDTTFDDAALVLGAMGSKTIGIGIIASAHSSTSGYVKFANGLLIQWGKFQVTSIYAKEDKFLIEFKSLPTFTLVPVRYADDGAPQGDIRTRKLTIRGFKCEITNDTDYTIMSYAHWIAIGY